MTSRRRILLLASAIAAVIAMLVWKHRRDQGGGEPAGSIIAADATRGAVPAVLRPRASHPDVHGQPLASISGTVRDERAAAIAGAWVCVTLADRWLGAEERRADHCTTTAADGHYRIGELLPVEISASAGAPRFVPLAWRDPLDRGGSLELAAGEDRTGIDFVLAGGAVEVRGIVKDIGGGGVAGAEVLLSGDIYGSDRVISSDGGWFTGWVGAGSFHARAEADGYVDGGASAIAPGELLEILLTPESLVGGIVVEASSRRPVAGARVTLGGSEWSPDTISDDQGRFRFTRVGPGRYKPEAEAPALWGQAPESVLVGIGEVHDDLIIEVHAAQTVRGTVTFVAGSAPAAATTAPGTPCRHGTVSINDSAGARSDHAPIEDGAVVFDAVLPGSYDVTVECTEHATSDSFAKLAVGDAPVPEQRWQVGTGARLHGRVTDAEGAPVASAAIIVLPTGSARRRDEWNFALSERDGSYEIHGLADGAYSLMLSSEDRPALPEPKAIVVAGDTEVDLELPPGRAIDGVVVDQDGRPIGGAEVSAVGDRWTTWRGSARSHDDGTFAIKGASPGIYRVTAERDGTELRRPGSGDDDVQGERVVVAATGPARVRLVVERATGAIRGRVLDAAGAPVGDAFVSAQRESDAAGAAAGSARREARWVWQRQPSLTDPDGRFTIEHLGPGSYTVIAQRKGGGEVVSEHAALGSDLTMQITPTATLAGRIALADGAAPIDFSLTIDDPRSGVARSERFYRTAGAFALRDLPAGSYDVSARAREGSATVPGVSLADGQRRGGVDLTLVRLVTLRGTVVSFTDGTPIAGMSVFPQPIKGAGQGWPTDADHSYISDAAGAFACKDVPATRLRVVAWPQDWQASPWRSGVEIIDAAQLSGSSDTIDVGAIRVLPKRVPAMDPAGDLGFTLVEEPPDVDPAAVTRVVARVRPDGPAAGTGLIAGDRIVAVDGHGVLGEDAWLYTGLTEVTAGTVVSLTLERGATIAIAAAPPL